MPTLLTNANIITLNDEQPRAAAMLVTGGRIVALFDDPDPSAHAPAGAERINLGGRAVIPGLVDAHVHFSWFATYLNEAKLRGARSAEEAASRTAEHAAQHEASSGWVTGRGWSQDEWDDPTFPTAAQLDAAIADRPVYLKAHSGHAAWVNSRALKEATITAQTPDPVGGRIGRHPDGTPDGILYETAMELVAGMIPSPTPEEMAERVRSARDYAHRVGLTGLHDFDGPLAFAAYQLLHTNGELTLRILKNIPVEKLDHAVALGLRSGFGDAMLRIGGVKTFADGALGVRTAWMIDPYEGEPDNTGICVTDPEIMTANVLKASRAGLASTIHAIGDRAVHEVLNTYELTREDEAKRGIPPTALRHRVEHVQVIHPDDVPRLAELQVIASMQPIHATSDMHMADTYWGERAEYAYNMRLQLEEGAVLALGSDAPIEPIDPLPNIQAAVTRRRADGSPGPEGWRTGPDGQRKLTIWEALRGFTQGPAYTAGLEYHTGTLASGYLADFVVLSQDITECDPMHIAETSVEATVVGGQWVHRTF
jgi:hypothetical protein